MYWFRFDNSAIFFVWIFITLIHTIGGWLIATHAFNLQSKERLLLGFGIGLVLYLWLCNFLGRWLDPTFTYVATALIVLGLGLVLALFSTRPFLHRDDLKIWPWFMSGLTLIWIFLRVSKGTGMFDEYKNLALISIIANGEFPVREYFGFPELLRYHYGYHIWGASMMRLGGMMPWSAFDLSKSIIWGYAILLAGLLGKRHIQGHWGVILMSTVTTLAGGTRYLLLLLPTRILVHLNAGIELMGISKNLGTFTDAMKTVWVPDAAPPVNYPFAFLSGINPSFVMAHSGSWTLGIALLFLFILLLPKTKKAPSFIFLTLFFSFWALTAEASLVLICLSIAIYLFWQQIQSKQKKWDQKTKMLLISILIAMIISVVQGGTITAIIEEAVVGRQTTPYLIGEIEPVDQSNDFMGFSLRWPPAVLSAHLGSLPIASPFGILVAIVEMGIVIVFLPWLTKHIIQSNPNENWLDRILLISAWIGISLPIFIQWESDRDITRLTSFGMKVMVYLFLIYLAKNSQKTHSVFFQSGVVALALMSFSGFVLAGTQLTAASDTMYSDKYKEFDAQLLSQVWGKIPNNSKIYGAVGKGSILTGQLTAGIFTYPPGMEGKMWKQLRSNPSFEILKENRFEFAYFDRASGKYLHDNQLESDCVSIFGYAEDGSGENFAGFYDLRNCYNLTD